MEALNKCSCYVISILVMIIFAFSVYASIYAVDSGYQNIAFFS